MSANPQFNSDSRIPQTEQPMCDCGNDRVMPGYRVCASCKEAREMSPHLFEGQPPDELPPTPPQTAPKFKVGDYAAGKSGYYAGFIVASSPQIVYFTWPSQVDDILFYGPPDDMVLIMPAAAAPYFEQFVGDEGGAE